MEDINQTVFNEYSLVTYPKQWLLPFHLFFDLVSHGHTCSFGLQVFLEVINGQQVLRGQS